jgi:hypothetical protein
MYYSIFLNNYGVVCFSQSRGSRTSLLLLMKFSAFFSHVGHVHAYLSGWSPYGSEPLDEVQVNRPGKETEEQQCDAAVQPKDCK